MRSSRWRSPRSAPRTSGKGSFGPRRKPPSAELTEAVDGIIARVRPDLSEDQRELAATVIAGDMRPRAKALGSRDLRRTRSKVLRALGRQKAPTSVQRARPTT